MSVPKQKTPKSKTRRRRSHLALKPIAVRFDDEGTPHLSHHAAAATGKYRGKQVTTTAQVRANRTLRNKKSS